MTTRFPSKDLPVTPLSQLDDYELVNENQDIRGWEVRDRAGRVVGRVRDLLVDTEHERVASLLLDDQSRLSVSEVSIGSNFVMAERKEAAPVAPASLVAGLGGLGAVSPLDVGQSLAELDMATRVEQLASKAVTPAQTPSSSKEPATLTGAQLEEASSRLATGASDRSSPALAGSSDPVGEVRLVMGLERAAAAPLASDTTTSQAPITRPAGSPASVAAAAGVSSVGGLPRASSEPAQAAPFAEIAMALGVEHAATSELEKRSMRADEVRVGQAPSVTSLTDAPLFFAVDSRRGPSSFALPSLDAISVRPRSARPARPKLTTIPDEDVIPLSEDSFNASDYELHYRDNFASTGVPFAQFVPAYNFGHELRVGPTLATHTWEQLEPEAMRVWESRQPGTWERFKAAVRHGWQQVTR